MDDALGYSDIEGARGGAELFGHDCRIPSSYGITEAADGGLERGANSLIALLRLRVGLDPLDLRLDICHKALALFSSRFLEGRSGRS